MEIHRSATAPALFTHNMHYLMRVFPSGMRVRSDNLDPAVFWRKGVQFVALNWQRWDEGMMLNEGMFVGSKGYVLKPPGYRGDGGEAGDAVKSQATAIEHKTLDLSIEVLAAQDISLPLGDTRRDSFHPYVKIELHVEKPAERTGAPIEGGGRAKEGEYKWRGRTVRGASAGTGVDFGGEKAVWRGIEGVVEELGFIRYVSGRFLMLFLHFAVIWVNSHGSSPEKEGGTAIESSGLWGSETSYATPLMLRIV